MLNCVCCRFFFFFDSDKITVTPVIFDKYLNLTTMTLRTIFFPVFTFLLCSVLYSQTPKLGDKNWLKNNTLSDDFEGDKNTYWNVIEGQKHGGGTFRDNTKNISFTSEGSRSFIRFNAQVENNTAYSGGIVAGYDHSPRINSFNYGYYEIEARVTSQSGSSSGLWPTFWTIHSAKNGPPYWYEEIDILEPTYCQVRNGQHVVGYWHEDDASKPVSESNYIDKEEKVLEPVDMSQWHRYAIEWTPGKLIFYLDDVPFGFLQESEGELVPSHINTNNILISLQIDPDEPGYCPPNTSYNHALGYYDVSYFNYYTLNCSNETITESEGTNYNFNNYTHDIKRSVIFKNSTIPSNKYITIRASEFVELKDNFTVPIGARLSIMPTRCN